MKKFVGDLSVADAEIIERYASNAHQVLEFGSGGSTQIIAQSLPASGHLLSVETDSAWIVATRRRLDRLAVSDRCTFSLYENWWVEAESYDLVFVDGLRDLRHSFARRAWDYLKIGGTMLVHDTRRESDVEDVLSLVRARFEEVQDVRLNEAALGQASNTTAIVKKTRESYVNWQDAENQPRWKYALTPEPDDFWER